MASILLPEWWASHILKKHHKTLSNMPGDGESLARHLIERLHLHCDGIESSDSGYGNYLASENRFIFNRSYLKGKSLTSIAIITHEICVALQHQKNESTYQTKIKYFNLARQCQKLGATTMLFVPIVAGLIKVPQILLIYIIAGVGFMLLSVAIYSYMLPQKLDASMNKALPILEKGGYLPKAYVENMSRTLLAYALLDVAEALADILRFWRWLGLINQPK